MLGALILEAASHALRGAFVGAGKWVKGLGFAAECTTQAAAIASGLLLIFLGLVTIRTSKHPALGLFAGLLGTGPTVVLFLAQKFVLHQQFAWLSATLTGFAMLLCAQQAKRNPALRLLLALAGASLLLLCLRLHLSELNASPSLLRGLGGLEVASRWGALIVLLGRQLGLHRTAPWINASLGGASLLLSAAVPVASASGVGDWQLMLGRTLRAMSSSVLAAPPWALSLALLAVVWNLPRRSGSLSQLVAAMIVLGVFSGTSPLSSAWLTLCAFTVVIISWSPELSHNE